MHPQASLRAILDLTDDVCERQRDIAPFVPSNLVNGRWTPCPRATPASVYLNRQFYLSDYLYACCGPYVAKNTTDRLDNMVDQLDTATGQGLGTLEDVRYELWKFSVGCIAYTANTANKALVDDEPIHILMTDYLRLLLLAYFPRIKYADVEQELEQELEWLSEWSRTKIQTTTHNVDSYSLPRSVSW